MPSMKLTTEIDKKPDSEDCQESVRKAAVMTATRLQEQVEELQRNLGKEPQEGFGTKLSKAVKQRLHNHDR